MATLGYIPDGHTETGVLNEVPGLYPRLEFTYRRLTSKEYARHLEAGAPLTETQLHSLIVVHMAARILSWDLKDAKGMPAPISEAVCSQQVRALFQRLWKILSGLEGPDVSPKQVAADADAAFRAALEAARTERPVGVVQEEHDRKN